MFCTSAGIQKWNKVFAVYCLLLIANLLSTDLNIHKQRKTQASWVSATDSYWEKSLPVLLLHFARHMFANNLFSSYHVSVLAVMWFSVAFQNTKTVVSAADVKSCQVSTLVVRQTEFKRYFRCPRMPDRLYCPLLRNNHQLKKSINIKSYFSSKTVSKSKPPAGVTTGN